jgi:hypothetical protein
MSMHTKDRIALAAISATQGHFLPCLSGPFLVPGVPGMLLRLFIEKGCLRKPSGVALRIRDCSISATSALRSNFPIAFRMIQRRMTLRFPWAHPHVARNSKNLPFDRALFRPLMAQFMRNSRF